MRLLHFYSKVYFIYLFFFYILAASFANAETAIEKDLKELALKLRCMTCQNQSIYESETEFAEDIKILIRKKLKEGQTKKEITNFLIDRYGEYIAFEPQFNRKNIFLWAFPFVALLLALILLLIRIKKN